jgi:HD-GYP domain-containing protein (c-di-GMP phosphodiesterase class II)
VVHDVGRVGVPNGIRDRPDPLSADQWDRLLLHPYLSERVSRRCPLLAPSADVARRHHERADGSGYHGGTSGDQLDLGARLLTAADAYHAITEDRPHRPALTPGDAASQLAADLEAGCFGRIEVDAVLAAVGQPRLPVVVTSPVGLTDREVEVLRLIARGRLNKQVAATLGISAWSSPATPATPPSARSPISWPLRFLTPASSSSPPAATSPTPSNPTPSPTP